jgi:hypothetical protein
LRLSPKRESEDSRERERTPAQRAALIVHILSGTRHGMRVNDVAAIVGLSPRGALDLLSAISLSVPLYDDGGVWSICNEHSPDSLQAVSESALVEGSFLLLARLVKAGAVDVAVAARECDHMLRRCPPHLRARVARLRRSLPTE